MHRFSSFIVFILASVSAVFGQTEFISNDGQWDEHILLKADVNGGQVYLEDQAITYQFWDKEKIAQLHNHTAKDSVVDFHSVQLRFLNSRPKAIVEKSKSYPTIYNFYKGSDPRKWASGVSSYAEVRYVEIYENIDLLIESKLHGFKYSFIVKPGGNPDDIQIKIDGASDVQLIDEKLKIYTSIYNITEEKPYTYQGAFWGGNEVKSEFHLQGSKLSFSLGEYNRSKSLIIDPSVIFSSLSGSGTDNWGYTATYDESGNGYTGGIVLDIGYPTTIGAFQRFFAGGDDGNGNEIARDCGFFKLSSDGKTKIYMTLYGGQHNEQPHSMVVNSRDELVVYGTTESDDLPITQTAYDSYTQGNETDIFIVSFSKNGRRLVGATYLGGSSNDGINGEYRDASSRQYRNNDKLTFNYGDLYRGEVVVDSLNNIYIASTTESRNFPTTAGSHRSAFAGGSQDAVVAKLSPDLDSLLWSTFIGGDEIDAAYSLDFDEENNLYVTGGTKGGSFLTTNGAYQSTFQGGMADAFLSHLSADGSRLINSTIIGTRQYDQGFFTKVGPNGNPWIFGQTLGNFPPTGGATGTGQFIVKMSKNLDRIVLAETFGANGIVNISPSAFSVDECGRVYISGWGGLVQNSSTSGNTEDMFTTNDAAKRTSDGRDFYMAVYTEDLSQVIYSTFWGGNDVLLGSSSEHVDGGTSRFDKRGVIYQAICAACNGSIGSDASRFPTFPNDVYGSSADHPLTTNCNNALVKIDLEGPALFAEFDKATPECKIPQELTFTNRTQEATAFRWEVDGQTFTDSNLTYNFDEPGKYKVMLIATNPIACNLRDTVVQTLEIYAESEADFEADIDICSKEVSFTHTGDYGRSFLWNFGDNSSSTEKNPRHDFSGSDTFKVQLITDANTDCVDTFDMEIPLLDPLNDFDVELDTCEKIIQIQNNSQGFINLNWQFGDGAVDSFEFEPEHSYGERGIYRLVLTINEGTDCVDSQEALISIPDPEAIFDFRIDTCDSAIILTNNSIDAQSQKWSLSPGPSSTDFEPILTAPTTGINFDLQLVAAPFSECADTSSERFRMPGLPQARLEWEADTCVSAAQFTNLSTDAPNQLWKFGNGDTSRAVSPFKNFRDTGEFLVQLIAYPYSTCPDTAEALVSIDTFRFADFELTLDTCLLTAETINTSADLDSFSWTFNGDSTLSAADTIYQFPDDGAHSVFLYGFNRSNFCEDTFSVAIVFPNLPEAENDNFNDSCLNSFIFLDNSMFNTRSEWYSSTGDSLLGDSFWVSFDRPGEYQVTQVVTSQYGCKDTLVETVIVDSLPKASFSVDLDSCAGAVSTNNLSFGDFNWRWQFEQGAISYDSVSTFNYEGEGQKTINFIINRGTECADTISQQVNIIEYLTERIKTSNVFTPNGDGKNDVWKLTNLRTDCDDYKLYIYNRWGVLVQEYENGDSFEWDGSNIEEFLLGKDKPMAAGTYFYVLKSNQVERQGTITLLR